MKHAGDASNPSPERSPDVAKRNPGAQHKDIFIHATLE
jgi:hypothetical protein